MKIFVAIYLHAIQALLAFTFIYAAIYCLMNQMPAAGGWLIAGALFNSACLFINAQKFIEAGL